MKASIDCDLPEESLSSLPTETIWKACREYRKGTTKDERALLIKKEAVMSRSRLCKGQELRSRKHTSVHAIVNC